MDGLKKEYFNGIFNITANPLVHHMKLFFEPDIVPNEINQLK